MPKLLTTIALFCVCFVCLVAQTRKTEGEWMQEFPLEADELASTGRNPYFILEPGYTLVLESGKQQLIITVLNETRTIDQTETRVVEERETSNGHPAEISRNYFAISKRNKNVYYFGEEVDIYKSGRIVSHEGAWLAGQNGARFGLMMSGTPTLRARYYQEWAPEVAMDRAEIVGLNENLGIPAGDFNHVLKIIETSPLDRGTAETKYYAPDVGLLQDGSLKLVRVARASRP